MRKKVETVKVIIAMPKTQYDWLNELLRQNSWLGSLDEFILAGIRNHQMKHVKFYKEEREWSLKSTKRSKSSA